MGDISNSCGEIVPRKVAIVGIPYDDKSSFLKGPAEGPNSIRDALNSPSSNLWTENGLNLGEASILSDHGNIDFSPSEDPFTKIERAISTILRDDRCLIVLGGDHSITYPVVRSFAKKYSSLSILHFDAHPDLYHEFQGDRFSHACPFARIMEEGLAGRLVQVGVRAANDHQRGQANRYSVEVIEMRELRDTPVLRFDSPLYISFDMDVLDPAFAPAVSHPEPGGLSTREAIRMIHTLGAEVVGCDIVELNPRRDPQGITAMAAAKILKEMAGACILHAPSD